MNTREMDRLIQHFDRYFEQNDSLVLHPIDESDFHVDVLLYFPTKKYPFWKLVTMGISDYKMPKIPNTVGRFNEYILFVDQTEDLNDKAVLNWYHQKLLTVASFAYFTKTHITYGHSFEWENEDPDDEMIAAFIEFPQVIPDAGILHCKTGFFKSVACLQVVLLNQAELDKLKKIGPQAFSEFLYPEDGSAKHFLSEKHRSERF